MPAHLDSNTKTDIKLEMEFHMINIMYAALHMCQKQTTFSCNDNLGKA